MQRQSGISVVLLVAVLAGVAAAGAGFFAWRSMAQLDQLQSELNATKSGLDKARGELKKATQDLAAATKDATNLKVAADRLTMERDAVRATIENEQAAGVRLRAELELAKDQISYLSARSTKEIVRGMPKNAASR
jgi:septal ring factor EnvC (AmiA/AmiB activator)